MAGYLHDFGHRVISKWQEPLMCIAWAVKGTCNSALVGYFQFNCTFAATQDLYNLFYPGNGSNFGVFKWGGWFPISDLSQ